MSQLDNNIPYTVDQVVDDIIAELPLEARINTANLDEDEFRVVELTLGRSGTDSIKWTLT